MPLPPDDAPESSPAPAAGASPAEGPPTLTSPPTLAEPSSSAIDLGPATPSWPPPQRPAPREEADANSAGSPETPSLPRPDPAAPRTAKSAPPAAASPAAGMPLTAFDDATIVPRPSDGPPVQRWPARVGDYDILGILGHGGMGVVYRAVQRTLNRPVALKMIKAGSHAHPEEIVRFRAEAQAIARLQHPNIVQVYEVGEENGCPFFSLEFMDGGGLDRRTRGNPQPPRLAAALVATLARAMAVAHQTGILHRDLKPGNVLLRLKPGTVLPDAEEGEKVQIPIEAFEPKITDFGLAKWLDDDSQRTKSGAIMGTPAYMSPEQAAGHKDLGPATDIYALAAILYELLTGRAPFKGETVRDTLDMVCHQEPLSPSRLQPKLPHDLETICLKGLRKDPRQRYASAVDLADDLQRWLDGRPILARRAGMVERSVKYARRKPWVVGAWAAMIAALLFLATGVSYYFYVQNQDLKKEIERAKAIAETKSLVTPTLAAAEDALKKRNWAGALSAAKETLGRVGDDPALFDLTEERTRASKVRDAAQHVLNFIDYRDQAMFHAVWTLEEGNQPGHRQAAQEAARKALAQFGLAGDGPPEPLDVELYGADAKQWLADNCYELYLTWAEVLIPVPATLAVERQVRTDEALHLLERAAQFGPTTQAWHQLRSELLKAQGKDQEAQEERDKVARAPLRPVDHFLFGMASYRARDMEQTREHLMQVLGREPNHFGANYCLAGCSLRVRPAHYARALNALTVCIENRPEFFWPYLVRGLVNGEVDDFDTAYADFKKAEQLPLDDMARYGLWVNRAAVRIRQGMNHDERAKSLRRVAPDLAQKEEKLAEPFFDAALPDLEQAVKLRPQQPQAYSALAAIHMRRERWAEAQKALAQAIDLAPSAALYRMRAELNKKQGAYPAALVDLDDAIRLAQAAGNVRDVAFDYRQRGQILFRLGDYRAAVDAYDAALAGAPDQVVAYQLRGEAWLELADIPKALADLNLYLAKGPPTVLALRARGLCYVKQNDNAHAIDDFTHALEIEHAEGQPGDPKTLALRGWAYLAQGSSKMALRDFDDGLRQKGSHKADCYSGRAFVRMEQGQWKQALKDAEDALQEETPTARTLYNAARTYALAAARLQADPAQASLLTDSRDPAQITRLGKEVVWQYDHRAVQLLERAYKKTKEPEQATFWQKYVEADLVFRRLQGTDEFVRLKRHATGSTH